MYEHAYICTHTVLKTTTTTNNKKNKINHKNKTNYLSIFILFKNFCLLLFYFLFNDKKKTNFILLNKI